MYNFAEIKRNRKYTHFGILPLFLYNKPITSYESFELKVLLL